MNNYLDQEMKEVTFSMMTQTPPRKKKHVPPPETNVLRKRRHTVTSGLDSPKASHSRKRRTLDDATEDEDNIAMTDSRAFRDDRVDSDDEEVFTPWDFIMLSFATMKRYYKSLLDEDQTGTDLYVPLFVLDLISFLVLLFYPSEFIGVDNNIATYLDQNRLPLAFVMLLLAQFCLICVERIIFLFQSVISKLLLQYTLLVLYHFLLWFYVPTTNNKNYNELNWIQVFYFLKLIYFVVSGLQIAYGYPAQGSLRFITSAPNPLYINWGAYQVYRAIPFLFELRTLLDWAVTRTTLTFYEWLKLEDIYNYLFLTKCRICQERAFERKEGDIQPLILKLVMGFGLFILLVFIIWLPLFVFMQGSLSNKPNPVTSVDITMGIDGYDAFYTVRAMSGITGVEKTIFDKIVGAYSASRLIGKGDRQDTQQVTLGSDSQLLWLISPPSLQQFKTALKGPTALRLFYSVTFTRQNPPEMLEISTFRTLANITDEDRASLLSVLEDPEKNEFTANAFFPRAFLVPVTGEIRLSSPTNVFPVNFNLIQDITSFNVSQGPGKPPRTVEQYTVYWKISQNITSDDPLAQDSKVKFVVVSVEVPTFGQLSFLATGGIVSLYTIFVLAVGRLLRTGVTDMSLRIVFEDMPEVDEIMAYCEDIFLARQDGDFVLEEQLFRELIELYRSPELIISRTVLQKPKFGVPKDKKTKEE